MSDYDRNAGARWGASVGQASATQIDQGLRAYMLGVYNYMTLGLAVTGLFAYGAKMLGVVPDASGHIVALTPLGEVLYVSPLKWVLMLAPFAFVMVLSMGINRISAGAARNLFLAFAAVMGLSLSTVLLVYTGTSVARAFFVTAAAFGGLSLYGYTTRRNLTAIGSFLTMGLFGLVIASFVGLFVHSSALQYGLSVLSVLIFSGLTAWNTQAIKEMYFESDSYEVATKKSVNAALMLYLDFVNIFMSILSLTGNRNN